jgi:HEAT repeat protein
MVGGDDTDGTLSTVRDAAARDLFIALSKALRAFQLYDEKNPVYHRFVSALRDSFLRLWATERELTFAVEEARILLDGVSVYDNESRTESLAFLFYKDGVREVTFLPGIEQEELPRLLSVLHRVRFVGPADDVLTMLWDEGLQCFRYQYVDYLSEGVELPQPGEGAEPEKLSQAHEQELAEAREALTSNALQLVDMESFNPTLYALDPREMEQLDRDLQAEVARDLRGDVLSALFDRLEETYDLDRQSEILSLLRTLLPNLLGRGAIDAAGRVLRELRAIERTPGTFDAKRKAELNEIFDEVSAPQVMGELVNALEEGSISPTPPALGDFLLNLNPQALPWVLRASETVAVKELQPVLRDAVRGIAESNRALLVQLIASPDPLIAAGAARLAGAMQVQEAASVIQELMRHPEPPARLAAVEAAAGLRASTAVGAIPEALTDADRSVRIAAARALGRLRYAPAAARFRSLLTSKEMRLADITEKIAFFEAYADLGDAGAVGVLDKLLNARGLIGRKEPSEVRAAAALALGRIGTPDARKSLEASSRDDDAVVRSAVGRALRGNR